MVGSPIPMPNVLIVDDTKFTRLQLRHLLEEAGYTVSEASSGTEALNLCRQANFDLVTMDINMPGMNGIETLTKLRELQPDVKVVVVSASAISETVKQAVVMGANDFIAKPVDHDRLLDTVLRLCPLG